MAFISALSEGFSPSGHLEGSIITPPLPVLLHSSAMEGNGDFSPHVISSHGRDPEVNTGFPKLLSVLPSSFPLRLAGHYRSRSLELLPGSQHVTRTCPGA